MGTINAAWAVGNGFDELASADQIFQRVAHEAWVLALIANDVRQGGSISRELEARLRAGSMARRRPCVAALKGAA